MTLAQKRPKYNLFQKLALLVMGEKRSKIGQNHVL